MSRNTPWSHSSLPSDRIKPKGAPNVAKPKAKGKQQAQQPPNPPKSKNAQRIETLWLSVKNSTGRERDPKGGCFCLGAPSTLASDDERRRMMNTPSLTCSSYSRPITVHTAMPILRSDSVFRQSSPVLLPPLRVNLDDTCFARIPYQPT
jgi:hypothetical protein